MTSLLVNLDGTGPLYAQIYRALRGEILSGVLPPGTRLPPSRTLAKDVSTSRNVVVLAYEQLASEGYVDSRMGAGTFVAADLPDFVRTENEPVRDVEARELPEANLSPYAHAAMKTLADDANPRPASSQPRYDFRYGRISPDRRGMNDWYRLLGREAKHAQTDYGPATGEPEFRAAVCDYLRRSRGVRCTPRQVLIVTGSQQGLDLTARVMLSPGDAVLIEEPHYRGARQVFTAAGAKLIPVPVDEEGFDLEKAPSPRARLAYVTPSHQFPTGAVMSLRRRLALLAWAKAEGAYVVEDDYDSEFRYQGQPIEAVQGLDDNHRTIYIGTFSKVLSPALRIGYMVLPPQLVEAFTAAKWLSDRHTPRLEQSVAARFIETGQFEQHLRRTRQANSRRRAAVLHAIHTYIGNVGEVVGTNAGLHLLLWLHGWPRRSEAAIQKAALARGVGVYPVSHLYACPPDRVGLLIGYSSLEERDIHDGIAKLAAALASCANDDT